MAETSAGRSRARRGRSCWSTPADRLPRNATNDRSLGDEAGEDGDERDRSLASVARMMVVMRNSVARVASGERHTAAIGRRTPTAPRWEDGQRPENSSEISAASACGRPPRAAGRGVLPDLLGARQARDHARHRRLREQPAEGRLQHRDAALVREGAVAVEQVPRRVVDEVTALAHDARVGRKLVAPELAGQQPVVQREERQETEPEVPDRGQHLGFRPAGEQVVLVLRGDE